jgi:hypothetical protein
MQLGHREGVIQEGSSRYVRPPPPAFGLPAAADGEAIAHSAQVVDEARRTGADATDAARETSQHVEPDKAHQRPPSSACLSLLVGFDEVEPCELIARDKPKVGDRTDQGTVALG